MSGTIFEAEGALPRAERPLEVREIAHAVAAEWDMGMGSTKAANHAVAPLRTALAWPDGRLRCERRGKEPMVVWAEEAERPPIAPR